MKDVRLKRGESDLCCRTAFLLFLFEELIIKCFPDLCLTVMAGICRF